MTNLKGVSSGDFGDALTALLGPYAPDLSPNTIVRLKKGWEKDYEAWSRSSLAGKRYVYFWVNGSHCNVRLEDQRSCILVVIGARTTSWPEGCKYPAEHHAALS